MCNNIVNSVKECFNDGSRIETSKDGKRVRREKKNDGLYEMSGDCKTLLTEDNKLILND